MASFTFLLEETVYQVTLLTSRRRGKTLVYVGQVFSLALVVHGWSKAYEKYVFKFIWGFKEYYELFCFFVMIEHAG